MKRSMFTRPSGDRFYRPTTTERPAQAWTAHRAGAVNMELTNLELAETVAEAVEIAQRAGIPAQNFIVGDRQGKIAWTIAGRIPARAWYDATLPAVESRPR